MSSACWIFLGILLAAISSGNATNKRGVKYFQDRPRRSLMNLNAMVKGATGKSGADFVGYGNWCGLGGEGTPIDPIDECCQIHDLCYNLTTRGPCHKLGPKAVYQVEYKWSTTDDENIFCDEDTDRCKSAMCMCDVVFTDCLKKNMEFYDEKNVNKLSLFELLKEAEWLTQP